MNKVGFRYKWFARADIDAFFGLFFDGFAKVILAVGVMSGALGMDESIVMGRVVPGIAMANIFGNLWYAYEARVLAKKENRQNVTAQPYGLGSSQVFGWLYLIMLPVYVKTGDALGAWQVGLAACFIGGIIEILGAFVGKWIVKITPTAALLGNLASGAVVWLSLVSMLNIFDKPIIALFSLIFILIAFLSKLRLPFGIPAGVVGVIISVAVAWLSGNMEFSALQTAFGNVSPALPQPVILDIFHGMGKVVPFLPIILPLQISNFINTLQGCESAHKAGDSYPVRRSMIVDGAGTLIGALFGCPFPTTVYYGHPGWKNIGARAGYSVLNAAAYAVLCFGGLMGIVVNVIPYNAVMPILVFVGIISAAQAVKASSSRHLPAVFLSLIPIVAQYLTTAIDAALQIAGTSVEQVGYQAFEAAAFPAGGVYALSQGALLTSLLLAMCICFVIDRRFIAAAFSALTMSFASATGFIHAETMGLLPQSGRVFAAIYLAASLLCLLLYFLRNSRLFVIQGEEKEESAEDENIAAERVAE